MNSVTSRTKEHDNNNHRSLSPLQELKALDVIMACKALPMTARVVMYQLVRWTHGDKDHCYHGHSWASREKLAERLGRDSVTTITTATKELKACDLIIIKRRPNATSLIRPNWKKIRQIAMSSSADQQEVDSEGQKTVLPEDQKVELPEDQKTGPYSIDRDSADRHSTDQVFTAPHGAVETLDVPPESHPSGAPADDEHAARTEYVEDLTEPEFLRVLEENLPAYNPFENYKPQRDKDRAARYQFAALMRLGWKRLEILEGIEAYLREFHHHDSSSFHGNGACGKTLGALLAHMVQQCDPDSRNTPDGAMWDDWHLPSRFRQDEQPKPDQTQSEAADIGNPDHPPEYDAESWQYSPDDIARNTAAPPEDDRRRVANDNTEPPPEQQPRYGT